MKSLFVLIFATSLMVGTAAMANGPAQKTHLGLKGKDGAKVNCKYCHTVAKLPKKKGQDKSAFSKNAFCAGSACHK